jgi:tetratricopeptide (TPR) repeat protein
MLNRLKKIINRQHTQTEKSSDRQQVSINLTSITEALYQIERGDTFWAENQLEAAIDCYRQAIELDPLSGTAHHKIALALKQQGNLQESAVYYRKAIALNNNDSTRQDNDRELSLTTNLINNSLTPLLNETKTFEFQDKKTNVSSAIVNQKQDNQNRQFGLEAAQLYLEQALAYCDRQQWQEAIQACEQALQMSPTMAEAHKISGNALQKLGKTPEAIGAYAKALAIQPDLADVYANVGSLYAQQKKWQQAIDYYQKAVAINPNLASVHRNLAKVWKQLGEEEKVLECLDRLFELEPDKIHPDEHLEIGKALSKAGKHREAVKYYRQGLQLNPYSIDAYQHLAETLEQLDEWKEANACYRKMFELANSKILEQKSLPAGKDGVERNVLPTTSVITNERSLLSSISLPPSSDSKLSVNIAPQQGQIVHDSPEDRIKQGDAYLQKKHWQKAIACYQKAIELNPHYVDAYLRLGEVFNDRGHKDKAIVCYQKVIRLQPDNDRAHHNLGDLLNFQQRWEEAISAYRHAIELNSDFSWSHNNLGDALLKLELWQEAASCFRRAIELNPDFVWSHYNFGKALVKLQQWDEAIEAYQKALKLKPDLKEAEQELNYVQAHRVELDLESAFKCYLRAIEQDPTDIDSYRKALEIKPDDPELCIGLANALVARGEV